MRPDRTLLAGLTLGSVAALASQQAAPDDTLLTEIRDRVVQLQEGQAELREEFQRLSEQVSLSSAPVELEPEVLADTSAESQDEPRQAQTWVLRNAVGNNLVQVGADDRTNAYDGDTPITAALPMLAFHPGNPELPGELIEAGHFDAWSGGTVMLTSPIAGSELTSIERADQIVREELGEGWRFADFHLGGGWRFWARGHVPAEQRFWVQIRDQQANPWSTGDSSFTSFEDLFFLGDC